MLAGLVLFAVNEQALRGSGLTLQPACQDADDDIDAMHRAGNAVASYAPAQIQAEVEVRI